MYKLTRKIEKVFTSKFIGTGPSSYEKNNLLGRGLTKVEKHCSRGQQSRRHLRSLHSKTLR
jgi:hypothetical protein